MCKQQERVKVEVDFRRICSSDTDYLDPTPQATTELVQSS